MTNSFPTSVLLPSMLLLLAAIFVDSNRGHACQIIQKHSASPANSSEIHDEILELLKKNRLEQAEQKLSLALQGDPHNTKIHLLRRALGNAYARSGKRAEAGKQFELFLNYILDSPAHSRPLLRHLPSILINVPFIRNNTEPQASDTLARVVDLLSTAVIESPGNVAYSSGLTAAVGLQGRSFINMGRWDTAQQVHMQEVDRLRTRWRVHNENPNSWFMLATNLKSTADVFNTQNPSLAEMLRNERENVLRASVVRFPESNQLIAAYFEDRFAQVALWEPSMPKQAQAMLIDLQEQLIGVTKRRENNRAMVSIKISLEQSLQQTTRRLRRETMLGHPISFWNDVEWLNTPAPVEPSRQDKWTVIVFVSSRQNDSLIRFVKYRDQLQRFSKNVTLVGILPKHNSSFRDLPGNRKTDIPTELARSEQYKMKVTKDFLNKYQVTQPIGIAADARRLADAFGYSDQHAVFIIDSDGKCRQWLPKSVTEVELEAAVESYFRRP